MLLSNPETLESSLLNEIHKGSKLLSDHNHDRFSFFTKLLSHAKLAELSPIQKTLLSEMVTDKVKP